MQRQEGGTWISVTWRMQVLVHVHTMPAGGWKEWESWCCSSTAGLASVWCTAVLGCAFHSWVSPTFAGGCNVIAMTIQTLMDLNSALRNSSLQTFQTPVMESSVLMQWWDTESWVFSSTESFRNHHEKVKSQTELTGAQGKAFWLC